MTGSPKARSVCTHVSVEYIKTVKQTDGESAGSTEVRHMQAHKRFLGNPLYLTFISIHTCTSPKRNIN